MDVLDGGRSSVLQAKGVPQLGGAGRDHQGRGHGLHKVKRPLVLQRSGRQLDTTTGGTSWSGVGLGGGALSI